MASFFVQSARKTLSSSSTASKTLIRGATSAFLFQSRPYATELMTKSPFVANILRILRTEIEYQSEYTPPLPPATKFNSFTVEDRPGEQWMMMNRKFGEAEDVKIEVTMFDGMVSVPKVGEDSSGEEVRLHVSVIVDVSQADGSGSLQFVCSAWPDALEVHKVYVLSRDNKLTKPYMGPHFRNLSGELRKTLREYLEARGVNDELSGFLHNYMMNKDRIELIRWLGNVKSFVEK